MLTGQLGNKTPNTRRVCLGDEEALLFVAGVHSGDRARVEEHLRACTACRARLAEAVRADSLYAPESSVATLSAGDVLLERYEVRGFIARGGMGEVYEAYDRNLSERVALKTLVCHTLDDPRAAARLRAEVLLARRVSHGNVCRILEFGLGHDRQGNPLPFLTMPLLEGETLAARLQRTGKLSEDEVASLLADLLDGLGAIHQAGIIHRDFKSENVFLVPSSGGGTRAVIMDFGVARLEVRPSGATAPTANGLVGTIDYMAPEQLEGEAPTFACDVYALGVILFEALTGTRPFTGPTAMSVAARRLSVRAPRVSATAPGVTARYDVVVAGCLERKRTERLSTVQAVREVLDRGSTAQLKKQNLVAALVFVMAAGVIGFFVTAGTFAHFQPVPPADVSVKSVAPLQQSNEIAALVPSLAVAPSATTPQPARPRVSPRRVQSLSPSAKTPRSPATHRKADPSSLSVLPLDMLARPTRETPPGPNDQKGVLDVDQIFAPQMGVTAAKDPRPRIPGRSSR